MDIKRLCDRLSQFKKTTEVFETTDLITGNRCTSVNENKYKTKYDSEYSGCLNMPGRPWVLHFNNFVSTLLAIENTKILNTGDKSTDDLVKQMFENKNQFPPFLSECKDYNHFVCRLKEPFALVIIGNKYLMINIIRDIGENGYLKGGIMHSLGKHYQSIYSGNKKTTLFPKEAIIPYIIEDAIRCFLGEPFKQPDGKLKYENAPNTLITEKNKEEFFENMNNILPY